jgi:hypothetical protein
MNLQNYALGSVVSFKYRQPLSGPVKRCGRIVAIRKIKPCDVEWPTGCNWYYRLADRLMGRFQRSPKLMTVRHADGQHKAYYGGSCYATRQLNIFSRICFYVQGWWYAQ